LEESGRTALDYLYRGIEETGISDRDFRVLEVLLHKGPLPVNTIGPKVQRVDDSRTPDPPASVMISDAAFEKPSGPLLE